MLKLRGIKARPHDIDAMMLHHPSLVEMHCSVDDLRWVPTRCYNVPLAVHLPEYHRGYLIDPASLVEADRRAAQDLYVKAIHSAHTWSSYFSGKPKIVFHPGGMGVEKFTATTCNVARAQLDKTIEAMVAVAGEDADILVENLPAHCCFFGGEWYANIATRSEDLVSICKGHSIGMTLDLCHLYLAAQAQKFDVPAAVAVAAPYVRHVHYSGAAGVDGEGLDVDHPDNTFDLAAAIRPILDVDAVAVPEVWFGHENGGAGFVHAWEALEERLESGYT